MDAHEAIATRHMVPKVGPEPPSRSQIEALVDAAVRAPTHHLTEPWRFIVLKGKALDGLGESMAERVRDENAGSDDLEHKMQVERSRPHRAPVIVVAIYRPSPHPKAIEIEDRYALGAAIQNLLLEAHASGLGAYWRTGPAASAPSVGKFLGLEDGEEVAGFLYVGTPTHEQERPITRRTKASEVTSWVGWEA